MRNFGEGLVAGLIGLLVAPTTETAIGVAFGLLWIAYFLERTASGEERP